MTGRGYVSAVFPKDLEYLLEYLVFSSRRLCFAVEDCVKDR